MHGTTLVSATAPITQPAPLPEPKPVAWRLAVSTMLTFPVVCLYASHFVWGALANKRSTGFLHGDMLYYMANVRTYWEGGHFVGAYSNAYSLDYDSPRLYFQPHTLVLALLWKWSGLDPGLVFALCGLVAAFAATYVSVTLFDHVVGFRDTASRLTLVAFVWGGGLVTICTAIAWASGVELHAARNIFDNGGGYWMHALGRNFIFTTEAYYHALSFGMVLAVLRGRLALASLALAVLCASHPFTGIQYALVLTTYASVESVVRREKRFYALTASAVAITGLHIAYYLWFLPLHAEHASLMKQWTLAWTVSAASFFAIYTPVCVMSGVLARQLGSLRAVLATPERRLFVVWFAVSLALVEHDLFITAHQPVHFTHGNLWTPLFLFGAPVLVAGFRRLLAISNRRLAVAATALALGVFCVDDATWFGEKMLRPQGYYHPHDVDIIADWLNAHAPANTLIVGTDPSQFDFSLMAYTSLRSWIAHEANTPNAMQRRRDSARLFSTGERPAELAKSPTAVVLYMDDLKGVWVAESMRSRRVDLPLSELALFFLPAER